MISVLVLGLVVWNLLPVYYFVDSLSYNSFYSQNRIGIFFLVVFLSNFFYTFSCLFKLSGRSPISEFVLLDLTF